ncbi:MAG: hypothetical protein Q8R02_01475 [Hyphomonadaceae bacterium]|nr:hypothetical protein [Hyphomonadaceae bacterium]
MPVHAQVICIGGNGLFALFFFLVGVGLFTEGQLGPAILLFAMTAAASYSAWVLLKFRKFLSAEDAMERNLRMERMQEEIDQLKANNTPKSDG